MHKSCLPVIMKNIWNISISIPIYVCHALKIYVPDFVYIYEGSDAMGLIKQMSNTYWTEMQSEKK